MDPTQDPSGTVTIALQELREGKPGARDDLFRVVGGELRRIANHYMRDQRASHTLQPTALVNEVYLKLMTGAAKSWQDRGEFLGAAARAMRSILIDFARARLALKRGGDRQRFSLHEERLGRGKEHSPEEVIAIHEALERLEARDEQMGRIVELRFFAGLTMDETAKALGISERSAYRGWEYARRWLHRELAG